MNTKRSHKESCTKVSKKTIPMLAWLGIVVILGVAFGYATTIRDTVSNFNNVTIRESQINIIANSSDQQALNLRSYAEEKVVSIRFWDSPTSNSGCSRVGEITAHGNDTIVGKNEMNFYTIDENCTMQNRFKLYAQENSLSSSDIILVTATGIADNEGDTIHLGRAVVGGPSNVSIGNYLILQNAIYDANDAFIEIGERRTRFNSFQEDFDVTLDFFDVASNAYFSFYWDKASYPGLGTKGFRIGHNLHIDQNLTIDQTGHLKIISNSTSKSCSATTAGSIYYDGSTFKHYGCNSTAWNALY